MGNQLSILDRCRWKRGIFIVLLLLVSGVMVVTAWDVHRSIIYPRLDYIKTHWVWPHVISMEEPTLIGGILHAPGDDVLPAGSVTMYAVVGADHELHFIESFLSGYERIELANTDVDEAGLVEIVIPAPTSWPGFDESWRDAEVYLVAGARAGPYRRYLWRRVSFDLETAVELASGERVAPELIVDALRDSPSELQREVYFEQYWRASTLSRQGFLTDYVVIAERRATMGFWAATFVALLYLLLAITATLTWRVYDRSIWKQGGSVVAAGPLGAAITVLLLLVCTGHSWNDVGFLFFLFAMGLMFLSTLIFLVRATRRHRRFPVAQWFLLSASTGIVALCSVYLLTRYFSYFWQVEGGRLVLTALHLLPPGAALCFGLIWSLNLEARGEQVAARLLAALLGSVALTLWML